MQGTRPDLTQKVTLPPLEIGGGVCHGRSGALGLRDNVLQVCVLHLPFLILAAHILAQQCRLCGQALKYKYPPLTVQCPTFFFIHISTRPFPLLY